MEKGVKIEDYIYYWNDKEVTFEEWLEGLKKTCRTDYAYDVSKKRVLEKIEKGITYGWNIEQKSTGIHLRIQRKEYKEGEK